MQNACLKKSAKHYFVKPLLPDCFSPPYQIRQTRYAPDGEAVSPGGPQEACLLCQGAFLMDQPPNEIQRNSTLLAFQRAVKT